MLIKLLFLSYSLVKNRLFYFCLWTTVFDNCFLDTLCTNLFISLESSWGGFKYSICIALISSAMDRFSIIVSFYLKKLFFTYSSWTYLQIWHLFKLSLCKLLCYLSRPISTSLVFIIISWIPISSSTFFLFNYSAIIVCSLSILLIHLCCFKSSIIFKL